MPAHKTRSKRAGSRKSRHSRRGNVTRTSRGRFAGPVVPAPNPGMNPFAPPVTVRLNNRWRLGDEGAVYEFNIKLRQVWSAASEYDWDDEVRAALEDLEDELRKKYPWIGSVYVTGRSGGWFAIEDPRGKMTKAKVDAIAAMVGTAKRHFVKHMEATYPRG